MTPHEAKNLAVLALAACPSAASFLDKEALLAMYTIWSDVLEDIDHADGRAALKRYLALPANAGKIPAPANLRSIVDEAHHGRRRSGMDAMGDVIAAIRRVGVHRTPTFDDPIVARVVEQMGWANWCNSENIVADRAHGAKIYDTLAIGFVEDRSVASLPGVAMPALPARDSQHAGSLVGDVMKRLTDGAS